MSLDVQTGGLQMFFERQKQMSNAQQTHDEEDE